MNNIFRGVCALAIFAFSSPSFATGNLSPGNYIEADEVEVDVDVDVDGQLVKRTDINASINVENVSSVDPKLSTTAVGSSFNAEDANVRLNRTWGQVGIFTDLNSSINVNNANFRNGNLTADATAVMNNFSHDGGRLDFGHLGQATVESDINASVNVTNVTFRNLTSNVTAVGNNINLKDLNGR